jgi:hypothetical protein
MANMIVFELTETQAEMLVKAALIGQKVINDQAYGTIKFESWKSKALKEAIETIAAQPHTEMSDLMAKFQLSGRILAKLLDCEVCKGYGYVYDAPERYCYNCRKPAYEALGRQMPIRIEPEPEEIHSDLEDW